MPRPSADSIPRRPFGRHDDLVSLIGLGGYHLGKPKSVTEAIRIVREAIDAGVDFLRNAWECHDGESEIPVNMWQSELKDETGRTMFRQLRTGVNCAYEITDTNDRKMANLSRARDMLETHVKTHPGVQEKLKDGQGTQDNPVVLRNVWVSHLTPAPFRPISPFHGHNDTVGLGARAESRTLSRAK